MEGGVIIIISARFSQSRQMLMLMCCTALALCTGRGGATVYAVHFMTSSQQCSTATGDITYRLGSVWKQCTSLRQPWNSLLPPWRQKGTLSKEIINWFIRPPRALRLGEEDNDDVEVKQKQINGLGQWSTNLSKYK